MRILMLTDGMDCGGAETHVLELSASLVERGHRVCVVSSGGGLVKELVSRGVFHVCFPTDKVSSVFLCNVLCRIVRLGSFDIIHSHARIPSLLAHTVSQKTGVCFITTVHARFYSKGFRRALSHWGEKSIAVSEDLKQYLVERYEVAPENVTVIPNGIDTKRFSPRTCNRGSVCIAFLSRLDSTCSLGAFYLCKIAPKLCRRYGRIEIAIGGGGDALCAIRKEAQKVNSLLGFECVKVLGHIDDVPSFLNCADIFVGVSRAAMEAALCGVSVIICGDEGFLGRLCEQNFSLARVSNFCARGERMACADLLYREIIGVLQQDECTRTKEAIKVRELMMQIYDCENMAKATEMFYKRALSDRPREQTSVLLCGYYGFGNIGDDALLRACIQRSRREFGPEGIAAITRYGKADENRFGIRCVSRKNKIKVIRQIKRCKCFVFGGGTLLQDSTSLRSLLYYCALLSIAKKSGARCFIWGNGIGEPRYFISQLFIKRSLCGCKHIGLRDKRSVALAEKLLGEREANRIYLERDLAMEYVSPHGKQEDRAEYLLKSVQIKERPFFIVAMKGKSCPPELEEKLICARNAGYFLLFVVMHKGQDRRISEKYCKKYQGCVLEHIGFDDLVAISKKSEGVYSMRFHALVAAKIAGVRFLGFGDDTKVTDFI